MTPAVTPGFIEYDEARVNEGGGSVIERSPWMILWNLASGHLDCTNGMSKLWNAATGPLIIAWTRCSYCSLMLAPGRWLYLQSHIMDPKMQGIRNHVSSELDIVRPWRRQRKPSLKAR